MDRSFLSDSRVIEASRNFVCMRLATYEDADEAKFLSTIYARRGALENTVFAILAPDGKSKLVRSGRGPTFRNPAQMAQAMSGIVSRDYKHAAKERWSDRTLPEMKSVELAINVASCDGLPLIVVIGDTSKEVSGIRNSLLSIAWGDEFAGQFVYASSLSSSDLRPLTGLDDARGKTGVFIVEPDTFGVSGRVAMKLVDDSKERSTQVRAFLADFNPRQKSHHYHVQTGFSLGLRWETAIPVTDAQGARAAQRLWGSKK